MKRVFILISLLLCATIAKAHESGWPVNPETNSLQTDSLTIISEDSKSYYGYGVDWHYLLINYSDGTTKIFDQNNNWIRFDTEYEMDLITDEKTDKPLKADAYWKKGAVKNVIEAEIADEYGKLVIKDGAAEYATSYNLSFSCRFNTNESISECIRYTFIDYIKPYTNSDKKTINRGFFDLSELSGNDITVKGPNGNILKEIMVWSVRDHLGYSGAKDYLSYYDETTNKIYIRGYYDKNSNKVYCGAEFRVIQVCSKSHGNTEIDDIWASDAMFVPCLFSDTINRFVWTDKVCEIYYSNGDYLKFTKKYIDAYRLSDYQIYDCIIHRPDGMLTIKLEEYLPNEFGYGEYEKKPVSRYEYTSGKYKGLTNVSRSCKLTDKDVLGVTDIIDVSAPDYRDFFDPKTNHKLTYDIYKPDYLYDCTLKQYVTLDGKVKDFEKEAREKIEKERQSLYQKYGKKYVDALFDEGKILIDTPEDLVKYHTKSTLINETQYTRTYKIKGILSDWSASVDVNVKTGKVTAVRNRTL